MILRAGASARYLPSPAYTALVASEAARLPPLVAEARLRA